MANAKTIRQVGVLPYIEDNGKFLTVLVTVRSNPDFWIFPKGHIEADRTPLSSAALEAYEEAGLQGKMEKKPLGHYLYEKAGKSFKVSYYPFKIKKLMAKWPESAYRHRILIDISNVSSYIHDEKLVALANKMLELLNKKAAGGNNG